MVGHSPVFQILLQIMVWISVMASPPAWTNFAGMLSTPADFPIFSALTTASTSSQNRVMLFIYYLWAIKFYDNDIRQNQWTMKYRSLIYIYFTRSIFESH